MTDSGTATTTLTRRDLGRGQEHGGTSLGVRHERAAALADFLRARRSRISPEMVKLPRGRRRRAPGLRREEVAQLAGVSVTWYTWLEQARLVGVSPDTLDAIARALMLSSAERAHLFVLALGHPPPDHVDSSGSSTASLTRLLASLGAVPGFATGRLWELLACNRAAEFVFDFHTLNPGDRNLLWYMFIHPAARKRVVDWHSNAQRVLAQFRAETAHLLGDPRVAALVERLSSASAEFAEWWPRHDVVDRAGCRKEILHPTAGPLVFEHNTLVVGGAPDVRVVLYVPLDEKSTREKLRCAMETQ